MGALRLVITGHVDHGKSTLIGRLFFETGCLPPDRMEEIRIASEREGRPLEFAFVMDHLEEERSRGITIDTAQRMFHTGRRAVTLIDAPGHREFLKNMLTGASQAEAALLVVDAAEGVREQTRRHGYLLRLLGCAQVAAVVNKMDLVGWSESRFASVCAELREFGARAGLDFAAFVPLCAPQGSGIRQRPVEAPWYAGPTLLEVLDRFSSRGDEADGSFVFPVQDVYERKGTEILVGTVATGRVGQGDELHTLPGDERLFVARIEVFNEDRTRASAGESIGLVLDRPGKARRGDVLVSDGSPAFCSDRLRASVFWIGPGQLRPSAPLVLRCSTQTAAVTEMIVESRVDSSTLEELDPAGALCPTEVADVEVRTVHRCVATCFSDLAELGRFVLEQDGAVAAGGVVTGSGARGTSG